MLKYLLLGFGLSFIGSLPFGIINMGVARTAIHKGMIRAGFMAAGAVIIEFLQVFVALKFTWLFDNNLSVEKWLKVIAIVVFLIAGVYFMFFAKSKTAIEEENENSKKRHEFFKGIFLSTINVMAIPYWIFYGSFLSANGIPLDENLYVLLFAAGTVFGTFSLLMCYALLGYRILKQHQKITRWVNRFIGAILLGLALYQMAGLAGWL